MRRRLALAASSASILSLILAATAFAGGWANAVMDTPPDDPAGPNEPVTLGFTLMQHGVTPGRLGHRADRADQRRDRPADRRQCDGQRPVGHWTADVALPARRLVELPGPPRPGDHADGRPADQRGRRPGGHHRWHGRHRRCRRRCWRRAASWPCWAWRSWPACCWSSATRAPTRSAPSASASLAEDEWPAPDSVRGGPRHVRQPTRGAPRPSRRIRRPARTAGRR